MIKPESVVTLGERIRLARGKQPREQVAVAIGKSVSTLVNWEKDKNTPRTYDLQTLADYLMVNYEWLKSARGPMLKRPAFLTETDEINLGQLEPLTIPGKAIPGSSLIPGPQVVFNPSIEEKLKHYMIDISNMRPGEQRPLIVKINNPVTGQPECVIEITAKCLFPEDYPA